MKYDEDKDFFSEKEQYCEHDTKNMLQGCYKKSCAILLFHTK